MPQSNGMDMELMHIHIYGNDSVIMNIANHGVILENQTKTGGKTNGRNSYYSEKN